MNYLSSQLNLHSLVVVLLSVCLLRGEHIKNNTQHNIPSERWFLCARVFDNFLNATPILYGLLQVQVIERKCICLDKGTN